MLKLYVKLTFFIKADCNCILNGSFYIVNSMLVIGDNIINRNMLKTLKIEVFMNYHEKKLSFYLNANHFVILIEFLNFITRCG